MLTETGRSSCNARTQSNPHRNRIPTVSYRIFYERSDRRQAITYSGTLTGLTRTLLNAGVERDIRGNVKYDAEIRLGATF